MVINALKTTPTPWKCQHNTEKIYHGCSSDSDYILHTSITDFTPLHVILQTQVLFELWRTTLYNFSFIFETESSGIPKTRCMLNSYYCSHLLNKLPYSELILLDSDQLLFVSSVFASVYKVPRFLIYWLEQHCLSFSVHTPFLISP